ncbi:MAG: acyl carrier protein [Candidatus Omnitrophota bacterium]
MANKKSNRKTDIRKYVKELIAEVANVNPNEVEESVDIRNDLGFDSLASVEILAAVETRLDIVLDEAKALNIVTVKDLIDMVTEYVKENPSPKENK